MYKKITMKSVASYREATSLESTCPINLIYGLNGSGKTTISKYLKSNENQKYKDCSFELDGSDDFALRIYNQDFIEEVFHNQDAQRGIFTLSKENKDVEEKIEEAKRQQSKLESEGAATKELVKAIDDKINKLTNATQEACFKIKQDYTGGDRILDEADFLKNKKTKAKLLDFLLSLKSGAQERDVATIKSEVELLNNADSGIVLSLPKMEGGVILSELEKNPIFGESIVGTANSTMAALIVHLGNSDWVSKGIPYLNLSKEKCPFCQQVVDEALRSEIVNYLDEAYKTKVEKLKGFKEKYEEASRKFPEWSSFSESPFLGDVGLLKSTFTDLERLLRDNIRAIDEKCGTPSQEVVLLDSAKVVAEFNSLIDSSNQKIALHNEKLANKKKALLALEAEFWQVQRNDYDQVIESFSKERKELELGKNQHEKSIDAKRKSYRDLSSKIEVLQKSTVNIEETIISINNLLRDCALTGFRIVKHEDRFYRISREEESSEEKVFTSLSEGEKTMISFFYFLELCRGKENPTETQHKIVVIDDPISSLSSMFVFNIAQLIKKEFTNLTPVSGQRGKWELSNKAQYQQCFILTHSLYFFFELADMNHVRRKETQRLFRVSKTITGSKILPMKYSEIQNDYQSYWSALKDEGTHPALYANCMRNIIEYFFGFIEKKELSNIFPPELDDIKFQSFYRYINRESHSLAQNLFDTKEFDYGVFLEAFKLVFKSAGYEEHFIKMMKG